MRDAINRGYEAGDTDLTIVKEGNDDVVSVTDQKLYDEAWKRVASHAGFGWFTPKLERIESSKAQDLLTAPKIRGATSMSTLKDWASVGEGHLDFPLMRLVVGHDWSAALPALSIEKVFSMPAPVMSFEFKISGRRVLAHLTADTTTEDGVPMKTDTSMGVFYEAWDGTWCSCGSDGALDLNPDSFLTREDGTMRAENAMQETLLSEWGVFTAFVSKQVVSICIAMEAEIAEAEKVSIPEKLNRNRVRQGKLPIGDFHLVTLARKHRRSTSAAGVYKGVVKLHFRRGHFASYDSGRVWRKWSLVGNPDLGWVEKLYRA